VDEYNNKNRVVCFFDKDNKFLYEKELNAETYEKLNLFAKQIVKASENGEAMKFIMKQTKIKQFPH